VGGKLCRMHTFSLNFLALATLLLSFPAYGLAPMQLFVEITPEGGVLKLPPGRYAGPVVINKQITLDGQGQVIIDNGGEGTVLTIRADGVVIRNLHLTNSGGSHNEIDAGILVEADNTLIENNTIDNSLFGIHLKQANGNIVRNNTISSKQRDPTLRGDGIRLWYSSDNLIEGNEIDRVRDLVFSSSPDNRIFSNQISNSRIGMEFVFSPGIKVKGNSITDNHRGIVVIYSDDIHIQGNRIWKLRNITGSALAIKESSQIEVNDNEFGYCAIGLTINAPIHPENTIDLHHNLFAYNDTAMYFYGEKGGHKIHDNRFEENHSDIMVSSASSALGNHWRNNYWDNYQGYDRDRDGIGDHPHEIYLYADRIWMDHPMVRFYRGSPVLELLDFVERLAPFSPPKLVLRDPAPRMQ